MFSSLNGYKHVDNEVIVIDIRALEGRRSYRIRVKLFKSLEVGTAQQQGRRDEERDRPDEAI